MSEVQLNYRGGRDWQITAGDLVLFHWVIAWDDSRSVVYCKPGMFFQGGFVNSWKLGTCLMYRDVVEVLRQSEISDAKRDEFDNALRALGHGKKIDRYWNVYALHQHPVSS